jgi:hypothetical protein
MDGQVMCFGQPARRYRVLALMAVVVFAGCGDRKEAAARSAFQLADTDGNAALSLAEFTATNLKSSADGHEKAFVKADDDKNSELSFEEFRSTIRGPEAFLWAIGIFSMVSFVGSLIAIPIVVGRLPVDHFVSEIHGPHWSISSPGRRLWIVLKNLLGGLLVAGGVMMLVLPGQGVLTMLLGIALMDLPGKWRVMRSIARREHVMKALNWMREKAEKPPLIPPPRKGDTHREITMLTHEQPRPGGP